MIREADPDLADVADQQAALQGRAESLGFALDHEQPGNTLHLSASLEKGPYLRNEPQGCAQAVRCGEKGIDSRVHGPGAAAERQRWRQAPQHAVAMTLPDFHGVQQSFGVVAHQSNSRLAGVHHLLDGIPQQCQPFLVQAMFGQVLLGEGGDAAEGAVNLV